jgi:hypothetical protein
MYIVKILKRKDAASLVLAIILGTMISQFMFMPVYELGSRVASIGLDTPMYGGMGWRGTILSPVVSLVAGLVLLEVALRVFVYARARLVRRAR